MIYNRDLQELHKKRRLHKPKFYVNNGSMLKVLKDVKPEPIPPVKMERGSTGGDVIGKTSTKLLQISEKRLVEVEKRTLP